MRAICLFQGARSLASRLLACLAVVVGLAVPGSAEDAVRSETLIRLNVSPAPKPRPVLRYLLLPELSEMKPGNPILGYYKCFGGQQRYVFDQAGSGRGGSLLDMPLKEVPAKTLDELGPHALSLADEAARLDSPDWQIVLQLRRDGINLLLPDVQALRNLARALAARCSAEVASGRIDDAIRTAKTMFALARHLGEHPTVISNLVGLAIANITIGPLEELIQQPACPNLYWALTNLPDPLVSLEHGMNGERLFVASEFRDLDESAPMSPEQVRKALVHLDKLFIDAVLKKPLGGIRGWVNARAKKPEAVKAARQRLVECGIPEERLLRFPPEQVILVDEKHELDDRRDEAMAIFKLPTWQFEVESVRLKKREPSLMSELLLPNAMRLRRVQGRLEQRIALLRHIEALRLYASSHAGALPARLDEISEPLPNDPFTGKPFGYELKEGVAHLRGTAPPDIQDDVTFRVHYVVTILK